MYNNSLIIIHTAIFMFMFTGYVQQWWYFFYQQIMISGSLSGYARLFMLFASWWYFYSDPLRSLMLYMISAIGDGRLVKLRLDASLLVVRQHNPSTDVNSKIMSWHCIKVYLCCSCSSVVDGYTARIFKQVSAFGAWVGLNLLLILVISCLKCWNVYF